MLPSDHRGAEISLLRTPYYLVEACYSFVRKRRRRHSPSTMSLRASQVAGALPSSTMSGSGVIEMETRKTGTIALAVLLAASLSRAQMPISVESRYAKARRRPASWLDLLRH
jgi:hypothetical protein